MGTQSAKLVHCPVETTIGVIGGKWKALILFHLLQGPCRYGELLRALEGISSRSLTKQLRELERDGILQRELISERPLHVDYSLTERGQSLRPVLRALHAWGLEEASGEHANGDLDLTGI